MAFVRNLLRAARPLADERPFEPLIRPRRLDWNEQCVMTMQAASCHAVRLMQPLRWDEAAQIVDHLRRDGIAVIRLAFVPQELSRRILDFLCGAALIHRAGLHRIAAQTYLMTPRGVAVDEPLLRRLEQEGFYTRDSRVRHQRLA